MSRLQICSPIPKIGRSGTAAYPDPDHASNSAHASEQLEHFTEFHAADMLDAMMTRVPGSKHIKGLATSRNSTVLRQLQDDDDDDDDVGPVGSASSDDDSIYATHSGAPPTTAFHLHNNEIDSIYESRPEQEGVYASQTQLVGRFHRMGSAATDDEFEVDVDASTDEEAEAIFVLATSQHGADRVVGNTTTPRNTYDMVGGSPEHAPLPPAAVARQPIYETAASASTDQIYDLSNRCVTPSTPVDRGGGGGGEPVSYAKAGTVSRKHDQVDVTYEVAAAQQEQIAYETASRLKGTDEYNVIDGYNVVGCETPSPTWHGQVPYETASTDQLSAEYNTIGDSPLPPPFSEQAYDTAASFHVGVYKEARATPRSRIGTPPAFAVQATDQAYETASHLNGASATGDYHLIEGDEEMDVFQLADSPTEYPSVPLDEYSVVGAPEYSSIGEEGPYDLRTGAPVTGLNDALPAGDFEYSMIGSTSFKGTRAPQFPPPPTSPDASPF
jgi:hypothetical protein